MAPCLRRRLPHRKLLPTSSQVTPALNAVGHFVSSRVGVTAVQQGSTATGATEPDRIERLQGGLQRETPRRSRLRVVRIEGVRGSSPLNSTRLAQPAQRLRLFAFAVELVLRARLRLAPRWGSFAPPTPPQNRSRLDWSCRVLRLWLRVVYVVAQVLMGGWSLRGSTFGHVLFAGGARFCLAWSWCFAQGAPRACGGAP